MLCCLCTVGCVTERVTPEGVPVKPGLTRPSPVVNSGSGGATSPSDNAKLPKGPVAAPRRGSFTATDIQVEVQPLGTVSYDGQALPLPSPSGEFIAVQSGEAPLWPALLAGPDAQAPMGTRLTVFRVEKNTLQPVQWPTQPEAGLMLGRWADDEGFLVESIRPAVGGVCPRWIGKMNWVTGSVRWLVSTSHVNAHATITPRGELIFTRRQLNVTSTASLIVRGHNGEETEKSSVDGAFCFPVAGAAVDVIYAFRVSRVGTDLEVLRLDRSTPEAPRAAGTRHAWRISKSPDVMLAFQMASTAAIYPAGVQLAGSNLTNDTDTVAMFDPRTSRMTRFNTVTGGTEALLTKTIGAVPSIAGIAGQHAMNPGYLCTGTGGLVFIAAPEDGWPGTWPDDAPSARVLASPYMVRALSPVAAAGQESETMIPVYLLIGPVKGSPDRLELTRMAVVGR